MAMEGLGAAASVLAVVDMSAKVASLLFQYTQGVRHAKADIERLRSEVASLNSAWEKVQKLLSGPNSAKLVTLQQFASTLETALKESCSQLEQLKQRLEPKTRHFTWLPGRSALKWPLEKKDVGAAVEALSKCTDLISLNLLVDHTYASLPPNETQTNKL
jgi:hypothetical protein